MKGFLPIRVSGGILSSVLAISLVITTLCSSLIILAYYYRKATIAFMRSDDLILNARSGLALLRASPNRSIYRQGRWNDLFEKKQDSVWLQCKPWGIFDVGVAKAKRGSDSYQKMALLGYLPDTLTRSALYLSDEQRPLSISGHTYLKGDCYLPKAGIKGAYVDQVGYQGEQLVHGSTFASQPSLPSINQVRLDHLHRVLKGELPDMIPLMHLEDSITHSFADPLLYYHNPQSVTIQGVIQGNVVITSEEAIFINTQAQLDAIIIAAPRVVVASSFSGRLQILATDTLIIGSHCKLSYPSALVLLSSSKSSMIIGESTLVHGTVFVTGTDMDYHQRSMKVRNNGILKGMVYVDGLVELEGNIHGHLSCRKFRYRADNSLYENHLLNATIDASQQSPYYCGGGLWGTINQPEIIQWL
ncbi:hypothetical protein [Tunicatimonas pelagia]|uniref:hypothetical protein n=1 Tax=Tunicatimonas pelagia TaxID=931531 RepID=UPI0026659C18|nr:hypothetical protein [Tunicatimonas pelagia]WKN45352.1 hypothetical protein P0M28_10310 [Tunicatimonas pelagia]